MPSTTAGSDAQGAPWCDVPCHAVRQQRGRQRTIPNRSKLSVTESIFNALHARSAPRAVKLRAEFDDQAR